MSIYNRNVKSEFSNFRTAEALRKIGIGYIFREYSTEDPFMKSFTLIHIKSGETSTFEYRDDNQVYDEIKKFRDYIDDKIYIDAFEGIEVGKGIG